MMLHRLFAINACLVIFHYFFLGPVALADETQMAKGVVFADENLNRKLDEGETRLPNVKVSNGRQIVKTNEQGEYQIEVDSDDIIFVIKPANWRTPLNAYLQPQFYYIHKPQGSPPSKFPGVAPTGPLPKSVDFPLYPQTEPKEFKALMFGDPQPRDQTEIDYIAHDVVEELIGTDASFGVTLGDIMFDDLNLFDSLSQRIALIGIPWYNVLGNHDVNRDAKSDELSDETFESKFGPSYYSFDYGTVHFLVLDDVQWLVSKEGRASYQGGIEANQIEFIKNDLALIPKEQLVVLMMHIPLDNIKNCEDVYRLIEKRPATVSISGHTHFHQHRFITKEDGWQGPEPHHHIVNVTVSGSWWSGRKDERGIPHTMMADGAPNGYSILTFNGNKYSLEFKAAGKPKSYQMRPSVPEEISISKLASTPIYLNVFNGSIKSKVKMKLGASEWQSMEKVYEPDPGYAKLFKYEAELKSKMKPGESSKSEPWRTLPYLKNSGHLWKATLPQTTKPGTYLLKFEETDMHGKIHHATRVLKITE